MSVIQSCYVIVGIDLTGFQTDKYNEWKWTDEGEKITCYQSNGKIQLFDDPMNGEFLYLGYIFAAGDQYEFETVKVNLEEIEKQRPYVMEELKQLVSMGVISEDIYESDSIKYELIVFDEYR